MTNTTSVGITVAVLALTVGCASGNARPTSTQPQASTATAAEGVRDANSGLARYVGEYDFGQFRATIRLKGGTLVRQVMGQQEQVLRPISENRFKLGSTPAEVRFTLDKSGEVIGVVEGVEGHERRGTRIRSL